MGIGVAKLRKIARTFSTLPIVSALQLRAREAFFLDALASN